MQGEAMENRQSGLDTKTLQAKNHHHFIICIEQHIRHMYYLTSYLFTLIHVTLESTSLSCVHLQGSLTCVWSDFLVSN